MSRPYSFIYTNIKQFILIKEKEFIRIDLILSLHDNIFS